MFSAGRRTACAAARGIGGAWVYRVHVVVVWTGSVPRSGRAGGQIDGMAGEWLRAQGYLTTRLPDRPLPLAGHRFSLIAALMTSTTVLRTSSKALVCGRSASEISPSERVIGGSTMRRA